MASYLEDVARMRQERAQRETIERVQEVQREHVENQRARDEAYARGDADSFDFYDRECERLEQEYAAVMPQQPEVDPSMVDFVQRNKPWFDRHGQAAFQALSVAHQYATRPRDPNSTNPANTGMGLQPFTPQYYGAVKDLLGMYGKDYGLPFDAGAELLTPDEAAQISGLSAREYNLGVKKMYDEGKDSATEYGKQWDRKTG